MNERFNSMGEDGTYFESSGAEDFQSVGQVMRPGMLRPGALSRPGAFRPQAVPQLVQRGGGGGLGEPQVRAIVRQELDANIPSWWRTAAQVPGAGSPVSGELLSPLGLGSGILNDTQNVVILRTNPQRPFRGERLVISQARTAGVPPVTVVLSEFKVGENSQLVGSGGLPADVFAPDAFGVRLAISPAQPGVDIILRFEVPVGIITPGNAITITAALIGRAFWGSQQGQ